MFYCGVCLIISCSLGRRIMALGFEEICVTVSLPSCCKSVQHSEAVGGTRSRMCCSHSKLCVCQWLGGRLNTAEDSFHTQLHPTFQKGKSVSETQLFELKSMHSCFKCVGLDVSCLHFLSLVGTLTIDVGWAV